MTSRTRVAVLIVSLPVLAFAIVGGVLGRTASAQGESYRYLRIFQDVVTLILDNYVEEVDVDKVMHGAMHGLADGLDPDSAYLDAQQMKGLGQTGGDSAHPGLELTRQVLPARRRRPRRLAGGEGRPAARRLRPLDRRPVDPRHHGVRRHAAPARQAGHQGQARDPARQRRRTARDRAGARGAGQRPGARPGRDVRARVCVRIAEFSRTTAGEVRNEVGALTRGGATTGRDRRPRHRHRRPRCRLRRGPAVRVDRSAGLPAEPRRREAGRERRVGRRRAHRAGGHPGRQRDLGRGGGVRRGAGRATNGRRSSASAARAAPAGRRSCRCPTAPD